MSLLPKVTTLELELRSGWLTIWFNQPATRNALSAALTWDLRNALEAVRHDRSVRGITLRGRGGAFCAGGDLNEFHASQTERSSREDIVESSRRGAALFDLLNSMPQAVVAVVEGAAMAGGLGLVCCADVVICDPNAKFALTETMIGLTPAQISPFVVQRVGFATARRLMTTAARFDGRQALVLGFADFLGESSADLISIEGQIRAQVLKAAPGAIASIKELILTLPHLDRRSTINAAAENFADRMLSDEGTEGIKSFLEKRNPNWAVEP